MAIVTVAPNGHLLLLLTRREAAAVVDELLDPKDFPWQSSENQMIVLDIKSQLRSHLESALHAEMNVITQVAYEEARRAMRPIECDHKWREQEVWDEDDDGNRINEQTVVLCKHCG